MNFHILIWKTPIHIERWEHLVAKKCHSQRSQEEILTIATEFVASTIVLPKLTKLIHEQFVQYFKKKASEILTSKGALFLSIDSCVNTDNGGTFSNDIQVILDNVEQKM